jgi:hypothetical protein
MRTTTSYQSDYTNLTNNTSTENNTLGLKLVNDAIRYLVGVFFFNERTFTDVTVAGQQAYTLPYNIKQMINVTVQIGGILFQPREVATRSQFDALNVINFENDYPQYYYIYNGQMLLWPIPASDNNVITEHYKIRLRDLSAADYTTGTVSVTAGSPTVTGSGTSWTTNMADRWIQIPITASDTTSGDDQWYQILSVQSATSLTLKNNYTGQTVAGGTHTIGEVPILAEDYQDLPLYRACYVYYTAINQNAEKAQYFKALYDEGYKRLEAEFGSKTSGVGLTPMDAAVINPNLYQTMISQA